MQNEEFSENSMKFSEELLETLEEKGFTPRQSLFICMNVAAMLISTAGDVEQWHRDSGLLLNKLISMFQRVTS
jgi:hypothetical protein